MTDSTYANEAPAPPPILVVFGGLPGTGKSTLGKEVARRLDALWLRVDVIETAIVRAGASSVAGIGVAGYSVAYDLAAAHLNLGRAVVIDAVNPVEAARAAWRELAGRFGAPLRVIEVRCDDPVEHRRRVEQRLSDIPEHLPPSWDQVVAREYEPWHEPRLTVDTAGVDPGACVAAIVAYVARAPIPA